MQTLPSAPPGVMTSPMDDDHRVLAALAWMCEQYLGDGSGWLDHECMCAGERALDVLTAHGLVERDPKGGRGGRWTHAGQRLLDSA